MQLTDKNEIIKIIRNRYWLTALILTVVFTIISFVVQKEAYDNSLNTRVTNLETKRALDDSLTVARVQFLSTFYREYKTNTGQILNKLGLTYKSEPKVEIK